MDEEQVFRKTDKGREEIAKRTHRLDSKRRMVLIVVDGQSSAASVVEKVSVAEEGLALLQSLLAEGYIEAGSGAVAAPQASAPGSAPALAPDSASLEQLKRTACVAIERLMGPDGEMLALRIEGTSTREEFLAVARKVRDALAASLGPKKAALFGESIGL